MNTRTKTKTKTTKASQADANLQPELVTLYRSYPGLDIDHAACCLRSFLDHRALFEALGDATLVAATERAWVQDAVMLAAAEATSADQARQKVKALQPALDGRDWHIAAEGLRAAWAMIAAAVEDERGRWRLETATRH